MHSYLNKKCRILKFIFAHEFARIRLFLKELNRLFLKLLKKNFIFVALIRSKIKKKQPGRKKYEFAPNIDISGYFAIAKMSEMATFRPFLLLRATTVLDRKNKANSGKDPPERK